MACATIHLAIAKKYIENHKELDYKNFIAGTLYPDAASNNDKAHFTEKERGCGLVSHVRSKVNMYHFLEKHKTLDAFELEWFLHLVPGYLFFLECFTEEYLKTKTYQEFCQELYHAYDYINLYMEEKYGITKEDYEAYPSEYYPGIPYEECILPKEMVDVFIKRVSEINLPLYISKIKEAKKNCKP